MHHAGGEPIQRDPFRRAGQARDWFRIGCAAGFVLGLQGAAAFAQPASDAGVVRFTYPDTTAKAVFLAGDFNGWSPNATPLDREGPAWVTRVFLDPGTYEYKFQVDGVWTVDAANPETTAKGNSVVRVGKEGSVEPPRSPVAEAATAATAAGPGSLLWGVRYLGFATAGRDRTLDRYDLSPVVHDIDLRLDARMTPDATGWFLGHFDNRDGSGPDNAALRYERGMVAWTPAPWALRLFDHTAASVFDDPAALVGRVGRYADDFGYGRRGVDLRRRVLGAPLEFVYADDAEPGENRAPQTALPDLHGPDALGLAGQKVQRYVTSQSDRGSDAVGFRARIGTDRRGLGVSLRGNRGRNAGRLADVQVARTAGDTLIGTGRELTTTETSSAWGLDVRSRWGKLRFAAEFLEGVLRARAQRVAPVVRLRAAPGATATERFLGTSDASADGFDLDHSRRVIVRAGGPRATHIVGTETWSARPGTGGLTGPRLAYEYEEHNFTALRTGAPFLLRRNSLQGAVDLHAAGTVLRLEAEQNWFRSPAGSEWSTQSWFRSGNFWLDEDVVGLERLTLLGTPQAAIARLHAGRMLWPRRELQGELHATWSAPGFGHAPRAVENILRFSLPVRGPVSLRTHSRLAVYRQLEPLDAAGITALGAGPRIEAGTADTHGFAVRRSYQAFGAHFVELVCALSARSDIALGFGVDPIVVYEVTNEYAPIGYDEFLFAHGASPTEARIDPAGLGKRIAAAEGALERERRIGIEARLRF